MPSPNLNSRNYMCQNSELQQIQILLTIKEKRKKNDTHASRSFIFVATSLPLYSNKGYGSKNRNENTVEIYKTYSIGNNNCIILLGSYNSGNHSSSRLRAAAVVAAAFVGKLTRKKKMKMALRKAAAAD